MKPSLLSALQGQGRVTWNPTCTAVLTLNFKLSLRKCLVYVHCLHPSRVNVGTPPLEFSGKESWKEIQVGDYKQKSMTVYSLLLNWVVENITDSLVLWLV